MIMVYVPEATRLVAIGTQTVITAAPRPVRDLTDVTAGR
jgi:hypothetical protein